MPEPIEALFVTDEISRRETGGGVQWCTREYLAALKAAGIETRLFSFPIHRSFFSRLRYKLQPRPYSHLVPPHTPERIAASMPKIHWCFLNNTLAGSLAPALQRLMPHARFVFLSHGAELTDVINNLRHAPELMPPEQRRPGWLGHLLLAETSHRASLAGTVVISEPDEATEAWLGSTSVLFLPRQIPPNPIDFQPIDGRAGCVATLSHGPNLHGLQRLAAVLDRQSGVRLRLVGGPVEMGEKLAREHRSIDYLGRLSENELMKEAATWRAFANPIFCPARGASMKVATALGWGLPVLTTPAGMRGYVWDKTRLPLAATPAEMADLLITATRGPEVETWFAAARAIRDLAPSSSVTGKRLRTWLTSLEAPQ